MFVIRRDDNNIDNIHNNNQRVTHGNLISGSIRHDDVHLRGRVDATRSVQKIPEFFFLFMLTYKLLRLVTLEVVSNMLGLRIHNIFK